MKSLALSAAFSAVALISFGGDCRDGLCGCLETERIYLSGRGCDDSVKWEFSLNGGETSVIDVPSCWETQGFGKLQYGNSVRWLVNPKFERVESPANELGVYRHVFTMPRSAKERHVDIVFGAVMTDCEVTLNGRAVGSHQGGYTTFKLDVTGALEYGGENELVVKVWKESRNESINRAERRGDFWLFGGIWRPVYLEVKPLKYIDYVTVDARADGTLKADLHVSDGTVRHIEEKCAGVEPWTAETPHLYEKTFELKDDDGNILHRVTKKIGFRTIEAKRGDAFKINGKRVFVKGINRHSFRPETGRTLSPAKNLEDVKLIKAMNMNAVRLAHYPADEEFLDLCDKYGLYVEDEFFSWQLPMDADVATNLVTEFVVRDQAHPSVIWWSNGNEGGWNEALDGLFDRLDPSGRPLLHPWAEFRDFHTKHYRDYETTKEFLQGDLLFMPTEFQHGLWDGGHAAGLGELWELFRNSKHGVGGFLWDFMDAGMPEEDGTLNCMGAYAADGILGPHGEKSGSFWAVREIWSPVKLTFNNGKVEVENRHDFLGGDAFCVKEERVFFDGVEALKATAMDKDGNEILAKCWDLGGEKVNDSRTSAPLRETALAPRLVAMKGSETSKSQRFADVPAQFSYAIATNADGSVDVAWEIMCTNAVDILGVTFDIDETQVVSKRWLGNGPSRVWRNRPEGVNFGLWENAYNDAVPGQTWEYPEFKGFFSGVRWMELDMQDGTTLRMDILDAHGMPAYPFVGVFAPRDGNGSKRGLYRMPELGLSVLNVIPAVGNKCFGAYRTGPRGLGVIPDSPVRARVRISRKKTSSKEWISVPSAPVYRGPIKNGTRAADGTSWFARRFRNDGEIKSAKWKVSALGVFEVFVNGARVGDDFLKPGFTHNKKTKYFFTYDVTELLKRGAGDENVMAAEVSAGWWRDKVVSRNSKSKEGGFAGDKSAFWSELEIEYADGTRALVATDTESWRCGIAGAVSHAAIFDGEEYDARVKDPVLGEGLTEKPEKSIEFRGELLPSQGAEVCLRHDLAMTRGPYSLKKGETIVVDFSQNCAAVPVFRFQAPVGTVLTALPGEMINDADAPERGCDGAKGSVYRANLRVGDKGMRLVYTFAGKGVEEYMPRFTFFGYRYIALTATDDVEIESIASVPVTSIKKEMETGKIETGVASVNRLIENIYWGQLSNYLSVPTDCPQRDERQGWTADTQVFCEAGAFNADTRMFFRKWMRDLCDSQHPSGGFPGIAPAGQYAENPMRIGWADAGVIVPWTVWRQFGDTGIIDANWKAMESFMSRVAGTKYRTEKLPECGNYQWSDWLSLTRLESNPFKPEFDAFDRINKKRIPKPEALKYWDYLGGCHWLTDARMMADMAGATGRASAAAEYADMADEAKAYLKGTFFDAEGGTLIKTFDGLQTPMLFALKLGLVDGEAKERTIAALKKSIAENGGTLHTGFLGTAIALDVLSENGMQTLACDLLLNRNFPGWLYSVDQGATTVWERWNSWTKENGFGPVAMNSFNHYAYGSILAWMYRTLAGIAPDISEPGFKRIIMAPKPDRRLGSVKAEYKSAAGLIKSAWRFAGEEWIWEFTIPEGATAAVTIPGETFQREYHAGSYTIVRAVARRQFRDQSVL